MPFASLSGGALQIRNRDQVAVPDRTNIIGAKADEGLRSTRRENKLDLKAIGCVKVDNRAQIATTQTVLWKVPIQNDGVEQIEHVYAGWAVMKWGKSRSFETI